MKLYHGNCLDIMKDIPTGSIDMVCVDPPYGTTQCKWDSIIDLDIMWKELKRIVKKNGAIVFFSAQPFTSRLISSNYRMFKQELIWKKNHSSGFLNANRMHLKEHENICVFYQKLPVYNKQMKEGTPYVHNSESSDPGGMYGAFTRRPDGIVNTGTRHPTSVLLYDTTRNNERCHSCEKPIDLLQYLIKTYTNEGETVLDFTMGSGTTAVAARETNRQFIGIEQEKEYYDLTKKRLSMSVDDWKTHIKVNNKEKRKRKKRKETNKKNAQKSDKKQKPDIQQNEIKKE